MRNKALPGIAKLMKNSPAKQMFPAAAMGVSGANPTFLGVHGVPAAARKASLRRGMNAVVRRGGMNRY